MEPEKCAASVGKYIAAKNALVAKYTFESLPHYLKQRIDIRILDLLISTGIPAHKAVRYNSMLRETQYFGMAAVAMALMGIRPGFTGVLFKDRWESVQNPLVALTDAEKEIVMAGNEILHKHRVKVSISDADTQNLIRPLWRNIPGNEEIYDGRDTAAFQDDTWYFKQSSLQNN